MLIWMLSKQIFYEMSQRKLRSFLAIFGIFWGTLAVVLLMALGHGFYTGSKRHVEALANGLISISPGVTSIAHKGRPGGQAISIPLNFTMQIQKHFPSIKWLSPVLGQNNYSHYISYKTIRTNKPILGVDQRFTNLYQLKLTPGSRFFSPLDISQKSRVVILGSQLKIDLFGSRSAINHEVAIDGIPFLIIGTTSVSSNKSQQHTNISGYIPYTTYKELFGGDTVSQIMIMPQHDWQRATLTEQLKRLLAVKYNFSPTDKSALFIPDFSMALNFFNWFFGLIQGFLAFCGIMTLAVGGIGVANIMFLIVTERTREIGLRMALGAQDFQIMLQVILESLIIVLSGGAAGIFVTWIIVGALDTVPLPEWLGKPAIQLESLIFTIIILMLVAILAGLFPAIKASKLEPVTALGA